MTSPEISGDKRSINSVFAHHDKFSPCQMALDSFILGWFKRNVDSGSVVHLKYNESWSSIKDGIDCNLYFGKTAMSMTMMGVIMVGSAVDRNFCCN